MLQGVLNGKNIIINVEMMQDSYIEESEMNNWANSLEEFNEIHQVYNTDQFEQSFFTKIYIDYGESKLAFDIMNSKILLEKGTEINTNSSANHDISIMPMYKNDRVLNTQEIYCGNLCIRIMRYSNKQIRSEINVIGGRMVEERYGFVTSPMNTETCKVENLTDVTFLDEKEIPKFKKQILEGFESINDNGKLTSKRLLINCY